MIRKFFLQSSLALLLLSLNAFAQTGIISTYVGPPPLIEGAPAINQSLRGIADVIPDGSGGFYFSSSALHAVYRITADGKLRTIAGAGTSGFSGDGGPATSAELNAPRGLARDSVGNLYIADTDNFRIRRVNAIGTITTIAGIGGSRIPGPFGGGVGDGGAATSGALSPGVIAAAGGNIYLSDSGRLRRIDSTGIITTIAGTGTSGFSGDGGLATAAQVNNIRGICLDASGNIYISESSSHRIRRITTDGIITTIAGTGTAGFSGDGELATTAQLNRPGGITVTNDGTLYFADASNLRIRRITPTGIINTIAGTGDATSGADGTFAMATPIARPLGVTVDSSGNVYFTADGKFIRKVDTAGILTTIAGDGITFNGDGGPATAALLSFPQGLVADAAGNLYIGDSGNDRVRKVAPNGTITTIAGNGINGFSGDGGPATSAQLAGPVSLALDQAGNLYIADVGNFRIRRVVTNGTITTVAGSGVSGDSGDGGLAVSAQFSFVAGLATNLQGDLFISDFEHSRVRKVTPDGIITTVAGTGVAGFTGDNGPAVMAQLNSPGGLSTDAQGNLYIADGNNQRIRKVDSNGMITTVAGGGTGPAVNGQSATFAQLGASISVSSDPTGNFYVDRGCSILKVDATGLLTRFAGAACGVGGDGGPATLARMGAIPSFIYAAVDPTGSNLYIAEAGNNRVRRVQLTQQTSYTIPNQGGSFSAGTSTRTTVATGYARIRPVAGATPSGVAIYAYRSGNYLLSETGVPATRAITSGRIYAEFQGAINTGLAIVNPTGRIATITFYYTDAQGNDVGSGSTTIGPNRQTAKFINELPFKTFPGNTFRGTFTFTSNVPVSAIAIRSFDNERHDFLMSTLPVLDLSAPFPNSTTVVPHFAAGGEWSTQLLLVNATNAPLTGTVEFRDDDGNPINVGLVEQSSATYSVPARSSQKLTVTSPTLVSGSVRIIPSGGGIVPVPQVIFSSRPGGLTISEAGVTATRGTAFQMYAEQAGSIQTAIAIANNGASAASVLVQLYNLDGTSAGLPAPVVLSVPPFGHVSKFLSQLFQGQTLPSAFKGIVRVSTGSTSEISVVELRAHYNERSDFLITTLPPSDESDAPTSAESYFPQIADGGNYSMQFVLFNPQAVSSSATVVLFASDGGTFDLPLN